MLLKNKINVDLHLENQVYIVFKSGPQGTNY